jgi:hypothetical protein
MLGSWYYKPRMAGMFCHWFLTIINIASITVTYSYRHSLQGQISALSTAPSRAASTEEMDSSSDWNYTDDAAYIDKIFWFQVITMLISLGTSNMGCIEAGNKPGGKHFDSTVTSAMKSGVDTGTGEHY